MAIPFLAEDCDIHELRAKIKDQGDKVRSLKTSKAPKSQISLEVAALLAFKAQYKATTGQEWEPETGRLICAFLKSDSSKLVTKPGFEKIVYFAIGYRKYVVALIASKKKGNW